MLGTATPFSSPGVGAYVINFPSPVAVTAGVDLLGRIGSDSGSGALSRISTTTTFYFTFSAYATFPCEQSSSDCLYQHYCLVFHSELLASQQLHDGSRGAAGRHHQLCV